LRGAEWPADCWKTARASLGERLPGLLDGAGLDGRRATGVDRVEALLPARPVISWVNAVEVYYRAERDHGRQAADEALAELRAVMTLDLPGTGRMVETARLKAAHPIALADCFAIATAAAHDLPLLTGDPEITARPGPALRRRESAMTGTRPRGCPPSPTRGRGSERSHREQPPQILGGRGGPPNQ